MKIEKIMDIDIYLFIEKGLRRGISNIAKRYSKVNNKCMENYDSTILWYTLNILTWMMCMVEQWVVIFLRVDLSG